MASYIGTRPETKRPLHLPIPSQSARFEKLQNDWSVKRGSGTIYNVPNHNHLKLLN